MKKKDRTLYIVLAVLIVLGLAGGIVLSLGGPIAKKSEDENEKKATGEEQIKSSQDGSSQIVFNTGKSSGGQEGQYYYIAGFGFENSEDLDQVTITFQERDKDSEVPFYTVEPQEMSLIITFSDTTDFDISVGQSTFDGEKNITCDGFVVKSIGLSYPKDDSSIAVAIETNTAEFGYLVDEQSLKLIIDIK